MPEFSNRICPPAALSWDVGRDRCHEGGIILSKKPPEWHLSLPQQRSASDSILRCRKESESNSQRTS